jgi:formiminotetrahydrofolate cyclodeaminase
MLGQQLSHAIPTLPGWSSPFPCVVTFFLIDLTKIIDRPRALRYTADVSEILIELEQWITRLSTEPLPGGVAAAALAAAMGSALIAKVCRSTLVRQSLTDSDRSLLALTLDLAETRQMQLVRLASDDEQAYRAVLDTGRHRAHSPAKRRAWQQATEVPVHLAELCATLLKRVPDLYSVCWPVVRVDLDIGVRLLETGVRAGLQAADANLHSWGDDPEAQSLRIRLQAMQEGKVD